jgi:hypothetical protein
MHPKMKLIEACEAIERNEVTIKKSKSSDAQAKKKVKFDVSKVKHKSDKKGSARKTASHFCTEHGHNSTSECRFLKFKAKNGGTHKDTKRSFSNKAFRNELNMLAKKSSKKKVLDLYATAINRELAKLEKKKSSKRKAREESDSDSDSEHSVNVICAPVARVKKVKVSALKPKTQTLAVKDKAHTIAKTEDTIAEEMQYRKRVTWLKDHGDTGKILLEGSDPEDSDNIE